MIKFRTSLFISVIACGMAAMVLSGCGKNEEDSKRCGYCQIRCIVSSGTSYNTTTTNGPTICDGDGGVTYAYDNAKAACGPAAGNCYGIWVDK